MTPKQLPNEIANLINERISDEYVAHYFYRQASNFCENVGYLKAAAYFKEESQSELSHAEGLQKYLVDWNMMPVLSTVEPPQKVTGLVDVIEKAYEMEYNLYEAYDKISKEIFNMDDFCTFDFLQKYRNIQRESVAEYSTFLNRLELIDKKDKNWVFEFEHNNF
jgi:ferritin